MKKLGLILSLVLFACVAQAQNTFNKFAPANGVLKGSTTTYVTSAAVDADIIALWTGTCSNITYLRGDGTCATPPGTGGGTVNSVDQTVPAGFTVSGGPITNSGVLAITYATGETNHQFLGTSTIGQLGLVSIAAADLPAIPASDLTGTVAAVNGGTGEAGTVTGVAKANGTSAYSAAVAADVYGLWSGTCSASTFLRGDGACAAPGGGTVTSIAIAVPSGFSVSGSPVTTSGTITIGGTLNPVAGGSGEAGTITGIPKANGTSAFTAAAAADVYGLWSGTCSVSTFLRGDGSCAAPGGSTAANPTALVGLTANNGTATTYMRSDASSALDQSISPTMTGNWAFTSSTPPQITILPATGVAGALKVESGNTSMDAYVTTTAQGAANWSMGAKTATGVWEVCAASTLTGACPIQADTVGHVTIPAPTGGGTTAALVVSGTSSQPAIQAQAGTFAVNGTGVAQISLDSTGSDFGLIENPSTQTWCLGYGTSNAGTLGTCDLNWNSSGNVVVQTPASGIALTVNGLANQSSLQVVGPTTASQSYGITIEAGTNASDWGLNVANAVGGSLFKINGAGNMLASAPTSGQQEIDSAGTTTAIVLGFQASGSAAGWLQFNDKTNSNATRGYEGFGSALFTGAAITDFGIAGAAGGRLLFSSNSGSTTNGYFGTTGGFVVGAPTGGDKGNGAVNMTSCFVNNVPCLTGANATKFASGVVTVSGATCTVNGSQGNVSGCMGLAAGEAQINFSPAFSAATCVASAIDTSPVLIASNPGTSVTSIADFTLRNSSSALANGIFSFICFGT